MAYLNHAIDRAAGTGRVRLEAALQRKEEPKQLAENDIDRHAIIVWNGLRNIHGEYMLYQARQVFVTRRAYGYACVDQLLVADLAQQITLVLPFAGIARDKADEKS